MNHGGHFIEQCRCGIVIGQCRCHDSNKEQRTIQDGCPPCRQKAQAITEQRDLMAVAKRIQDLETRHADLARLIKDASPPAWVDRLDLQAARAWELRALKLLDQPAATQARPTT